MDEKKLKALVAELAKCLKIETDLNALSRIQTQFAASQAPLPVLNHF